MTDMSINNVTATNEHNHNEQPVDMDEKILNDMGYKQDLYRGFNGLMSFSFCFTAVAVLSSISGLYPSALITGGPVLVIWSWIGCSICTILVALSMAEICSSYPSAGSVYHWAGSCCTNDNWAPLAAYITGWLNFVGNTAGDAFYGYSFASFVNSAVTLTGVNAELSTGAQVGIAIGVCFVWSCLNLLKVDKQGWLNNFAALWQIGATLMIVITVLVTCTKSGTVATGSQVFFQYYDGTGFNNYAYVFFIGLLPALYAFSGYEAAGHMAEETKGAYKSAPMGIIYTCIATALTGFVYLIGLLFGTAADVDGFVSNSSTTTDIFHNCSGETLGLILTSVLIVNIFFSGMSSLTVTTRIAFAMARDGAFPFSKPLAYIHPLTQTPVGSIILVFVADALLILLNLINTTAFINVTAMSTIGYQLSYAMAILMRITFSRRTFPRNAFHLGPASLPIGWFSVAFLTITSICFLFPVEYPVTTANMNWAVVVLGGLTLIGAIYWLVYARKFFIGPHKYKADNDEIVHHQNQNNTNEQDFNNIEQQHSF